MEALANQLADLMASAGPQLDDILRLESSIPYSKFINDFCGICINLNSLCQNLKPELDKLALIPKPTLPLNPITKQPDRIIVAELLNIAPTSASKEYKNYLKKLFEDKFREKLRANLDADFSLAKLVLDHNEKICQVMANSEEFSKPVKSSTPSQVFSNVEEYLKLLALLEFKRHKISYVRGTIKDRVWIPRVLDKKIPVLCTSTNKVLHVHRGTALYHLFPNKLAVPLSRARANLVSNNKTESDQGDDKKSAQELVLQFKMPTCVTDKNALVKPIHIYQILQQISAQHSLDIPLHGIKLLNGVKLQDSPLVIDKIGTHSLVIGLYDQQVGVQITVVPETHIDEH